MSAASTTVAAAGWGEDRRGEEGAEGETNAVTACRGRRTAGRLCARCFRAVAGAWPAGACSCWLRGELIVDQSEEPRAFSRFLCRGCIQIVGAGELTRTFFFSLNDHHVDTLTVNVMSR